MECPRIATLSSKQLEEIRTLEERLGIILVAYERAPRYKRLSQEELRRIQSLEKETGSILVAYEA